MKVYGLLITKDDHDAFGDWCRDQLRFYEHVVCLDGSDSDETEKQAVEFSDRLSYCHERDFEIPQKTDHGLRKVVHDQIVRRFGQNIWIMCCHTDEFCYHDPRKIASMAESEGYDLVSWFSPHFYPHPTELDDIAERLKLPVQDRFQHYHWGHLRSGYPWIEDRLYKAGPGVAWDDSTHGSVRPHGITRPAPYYPIYRHFKVCSIDLSGFELDGYATRYKGHWEHQEHRTGLAFRVEEVSDLFVSSVPNYVHCDRFEGVFNQPWNIGEEYRPDEDLPRTRVRPVQSGPGRTPPPASVSPREARPMIAIGPRLPDFGSWNWVGADTAEELAMEFEVRVFDKEIPPCDVAIFVKFRPDSETLHRLASATAIIYAPIDFYGGAHEIDLDSTALVSCDQIVIHCERLRRYFSSYAAVEYIDHHVKFATPLRTQCRDNGPLLWVGVRSNLPPLVDWVNNQQLPVPLWVLTNPEDPTKLLSPPEFGFSPRNDIRMESWTPERQREWTALCRAAIDVKGQDFRSRHKPPAKGIDYLASGVPLALQPDSSTAQHLAQLGFEVAPLGNWQRLFSREYFNETNRIGAVFGEQLTRERVGDHWKRVVRNVLARRATTSS